MTNLSIILPVFNEGIIIARTVIKIIFYIKNYVEDFEVIAINDGSSDSTLKELKETQALFPQLKVVSHKSNKGYGSAIRTGIKVSQKKWIFIMDSDNQFWIDDFNIFWEKKNFYDFILGYRMTRADNFYRRQLSRTGNFLANVFLGKCVKDINCGFKLFRREDLLKLPLSASGGAINFDILLNLFNRDKKIFFQIPVSHYKREEGKQTGGSLKVIVKILEESFKIVCQHLISRKSFYAFK